jgi:hypothetical protein
MLSYIPKIYKCNSTSTSTDEEQPQVKQFFFVTSVKDESIWKLLQNKERRRLRVILQTLILLNTHSVLASIGV